MSKNFPVKLNVQMRTAAAHVRPPHKFCFFHHYGIATDEKNTLPSHMKVGTKCATFKIQCIDGKTILILKYNMYGTKT